VVIVSQRWHLPRAIWLARSAGWEAWGMPAGDEEPSGWGNLAREHLVRMENFWQVLFRRIASLVVSLRSER
jgi:SanA protein